MAGNLDLNVKITADAEKLKKGMADAVNIVRGGTDKIKTYAFASQKALEEAMGGQSLVAKRRAFSESIKQTRSDLVGMKNELDRMQQKLANTAKWDIETQDKLQARILRLKASIRDTDKEIKNFQDGQANLNQTVQEGSRRAEQNTQAMEAVSRAVNAASMATLLLSGNNDKLGKVMRGVQVTMALASAAVALYNLSQRQNEIYTAAATVVQKGYAIAVGTSTGAMKAFRIALLASGIGIAVVALGFLVEKMVSLGDETEKTTDKLDELSKVIEDNQLGALQYKHEQTMHQLRVEGAAEEKLQAQREKAFNEQFALFQKLIKERKDANKSAQDLYEQQAEFVRQAAAEDDKIAEEQAEKQRERQKKAIENYKKYVKEVANLQRSMYEELARLQIGYTEWANKYFERKAPPEITISTFAPASVTEPGVKAPDVLPGVGSFMDMATQNQEAVNLDLDSIEQFRKNTYQYGLILGMRVKQTESFADKMTIAAEQATQALNSMAADMASAFGTMMGETIAGKADAFTTFMQAFANSMANFLSTFGKALIAQAIAIDAFKESLKSLNPAIALAAGIGLLAASALVKSTMAKGENVSAFADGGIVSGPTLGLMGEYPGARTNPEVIAPLDKLQSMINTGQGGNFVAQTKFDGRDLWLAVNRYEKDKARG